ncbi:MAG TPA: PAS domain-containing protein [Bacteroidia bacterium]|nr:PAS domain-containing protein [Bacteroidia bacterium]
MKIKDNVLRYSDFLTSAVEGGKLIYTVLESFPLGIVITNEKDEIIYVNFKMAQMTGYSRKEILHKVSSIFLYFPSEQQRLQDIIAQRRSNIYETYELYVKRNNDSSFLAHTVTAPWKDEDGKKLGTISIVTDITLDNRHKELEALALAATKTANSVMITDKFGKIEWINEGFTKLSGYQLYEVIDTKGELLRETDDSDFYTDIYAATFEKKSITREYKRLNKKRSPYWVISTLTPVLDPQGNVKEITIMDTDITKQKLAEIKLIETEKKLEQLLKNK